MAYSSSYTYTPNAFERALTTYKKKATPQVSVQGGMSKAPMSVQPKVQGSGYGSNYVSNPKTQPAKIQGSGYGSNYASNPSNYKPKVVTKQTPPPANNPLPKQQPQTNPYLDRIRSIAESQKANNASMTDQYVSDLRASADRQNQRTSALIPKFQENFNKYKGDVMGQIADEEKQSALDERNTRDLYGEAMRGAAQAFRESQGQVQNVFAGLGTLDSSAFNQQMLNTQSRFAGKQQENFNQQAAAIQQGRNALNTFRRDAQNAIRSEEEKLMATIAEIENTVDSRSVEFEQLIRQAYTEAKNNILGIDQQLAQMEQENAQVERDFGLQRDLEMMKTGQAGGGELKEKQAMALSANNAIDGLSAIIQKDPNIYKNLNGLDQNKRAYDAQVNNAIDLIIRVRTGAAATEQERQAMKNLFPTFWDDQAVAEGKLANLKASLQASLYGTDFQGVAGIQQSGIGSDQVAKLKQAGFSDAEIQEYMRG